MTESSQPLKLQSANVCLNVELACALHTCLRFVSMIGPKFSSAIDANALAVQQTAVCKKRAILGWMRQEAAAREDDDKAGSHSRRHPATGRSDPVHDGQVSCWWWSVVVVGSDEEEEQRRERRQRFYLQYLIISIFLGRNGKVIVLSTGMRTKQRQTKLVV